jgi:U3 small nucleolar RNA-associated protein 10
LDHAARTLTNVSAKEPEGQLLCELVLDSLKKSFQHDEDDFWQSPNHFNSIAEPLAMQLTAEASHLVKGFAIPAVTEFAAAASSADHHKDLNAMIMKSMRAYESHTRLAAVQCEQSLTERLGEEWLSLLPEMLPYISELQDDDNEIVEREVQRWIKRIEEILGESLDTMLQ